MRFRKGGEKNWEWERIIKRKTEGATDIPVCEPAVWNNIIPDFYGRCFFFLKGFWIMSGCCIIAPVSHCARQIRNVTPWPCCSDEWSWEIKTQEWERDWEKRWRGEEERSFPEDLIWKEDKTSSIKENSLSLLFSLLVPHNCKRNWLSDCSVKKYHFYLHYLS